MKNKEIGHIISKGGKVEDIQKVVPNFPNNPTKETFIELGYAESTAKRYIYLLSQNNSKKAPKKAESCVKVQADDNMNFVQSTRYNNILVDTCALTSARGRDIIESAKQVTFIFATLEEMDKKKKNGTKSLKENIKKYTSKMLSSPNKYMLSRFKGYSDDKYVDNILLQYMQILPKQIRPTLLTADENLATKALALELDYIFVEQNENAKLDKKLGYGIFLSKRNDELYISNKGTFKFEIHRDGDIIPCAARVEIKVEHGDVLHIYEKKNSETIEHIINI